MLELKKLNRYSLIKNLVDQGHYYIDPADNICKKKNRELLLSTGYIFTNLDHNFQWCRWCYEIIFDTFRILPSHACDCWKVTVRPRTFEELWQLLTMQKKLNLPSKCGIEPRNEVPANYGGYFYNLTLDEAKECYDMVRKRVDERISLNIDVIIKRGCTEMERAFGPSDNWKLFDDQMEFENNMKELFEEWVYNPETIPMTQEMEDAIIFVWKQFAHSRGDMTYVKHNKGKPIYPGYVTYHDKGGQGLKLARG